MSPEASSFAGLVQRTWRENVLFSVLVELTYRCNLNCVFCYNDLGLAGVPMSTDEWARFFEDLRDLQVLNLTLSGGEPLAHPDFFRLGRRARELGFVVRVKSNGHALSREAAGRLKDEVDPYMVEVSLHGSRAESHDLQTRVPGSFERLLRNVEGMVGLGLRVKMNATLTAWNEGEVEGMFAIADSLGVRLQFDPEVTPRDDGDRSPLALTASREGVLNLLRLEWARAATAAGGGVEPEVGRQADALMAPAEAGKHCGAGSSGIAVDPFGNVYPCVQWRRPAGNLHTHSIVEIWSGSPALEEVRRLSAQVKGVVSRHQEDGPLMSFCPGTAEALSGSPLVVYEGARQRAALVREAEPVRRTIALRVLPASGA